ncbi:alpha/beta hydrolase family protein [Psychrosphaera ytuae]|uniref:alpha/beta hydrolase family protein n=1 Tax=Psychrosphaera ytuae TaxID=2820710 RepID=UPI001E3579FB|nr:S9 family peptidase [Psychrosphaera ytuae]
MRIIHLIVLSGFLLSLSVFSNSVSANKLLPVELFSGGVDYDQVTISPTGKYLSLVSEVDGRRNLYILDLKNYQIINTVAFPRNAQVGDYHWVNEERIVLEKQYLRGWTDHPLYYGELFAINADGSRGRYLIGYQGEAAGFTRLRKATAVDGTSYVLDPLIDDEDHLLVYTIPWTSSKEPTTVVYKVNVRSGKRRKIASSPAGLGGFLTDRQGNVRVAMSSQDAINLQVFTRGVENKDWKELELPDGIATLSPIAFDESGKNLYVNASLQGEPSGIFKLNLESGKINKIFQDDTVSPSKLWLDKTTRELYAVELESGYPTFAFIKPKHTLAKRLKGLLGALGGDQVRIVSSTVDNNKSIVYAFSGSNPGAFYLFNGESNELAFLFRARKSIDTKLMAEVKPIDFTTRDGIKVYGYVTLPQGVEHKNLPLVVMPHGGPHGVRDWWEFDPEAQLLANRGIAVLKVNFRGSGGFGASFEQAGFRQWGNKIQKDIIDGTKYLIEQGIADKDNICIMGSSFGGYSALQSSIMEPDLFKCAIGVVGVYDMPMMYEEGDVATRRSGQKYLERVLGENEDVLKAYSPVHNIDKLKAPVLIVHGGDDERAPIEQAESLIDALKAADHPYVYELLEDEGHGFYKPEHRTKYYKKVISFLDEHLEL